MVSGLLQGTIRKRLVFLLLISALPALLLILHSGVHGHRQAVAQAERELGTFTSRLAASQMRVTQETRSFLEGLASLPLVREGNATQCSELFSQLLQVNRFYAALHLVAPDGRLIASGTPARHGNFAGTRHFHEALRTRRFATGEYQFGVTLKAPVFAFGLPVLDEGGGVRAVLLTSYRLDRFGELFEFISFPENSFVGAVDHRGQRLFRFPANRALSVGGAINPAVFQALQEDGDTGIIREMSSDGVRRVNAYQKVRLGPDDPPYMYILAGIPEAALEAQARSGLHRDLIILSLTLGLALLSGWHFGVRPLGRGFEALAAAAVRLGSGDLSTRVHEHREVAELSALSRSFNAMAQALEEDRAERRRAEEARSESEERLRLLVDTVGEGIMLQDPSGRLTHCNRAGAEIFGLEPAQVLGQSGPSRNWGTFREDGTTFPPQEYPSQLTRLSGEPHDNVVMGVRGRGQGLTWVTVNTRPMLREGAKPPYAVVISFLDITARKCAEEELKASEERYRSLYTAMNDGACLHALVYGLDGRPADYRILEANPQFERLTGLARDRAVGRLATEVYGTGEAPFLDRYARVAETGQQTRFEAYFEPMGKHFHISVYSPGPGSFATIFQDITDRKQAEERLLKSERQLSDAMAMARLGHWEMDLIRGVFLFSDSFYTLFRTTAQAMGGYEMAPEEYTRRFVHPEDRHLIFDETCRSMEPGASPHGRFLEHRVVFADGEPGHIAVKYTLAKDSSGRAVKTYGVNQDITERKRAEQALRDAKEAAEAANRAKSEFLANMSHEVRTPLNGILGMLQLMKTTELSGEQGEYADLAIQSGHRLTRLLSDILDISKVEAGKLVMQSQPFSLQEALLGVEQMFGPVARQAGVELDHCLDPAIPGTILGDSARLQQVLSNLVGNALKFTAAGRVRVEASPLPALAPGQSRVLFTVSDTGAGIPDAVLARLFIPFSQGEDGPVRSHQGAGLGLAICRRLVTLMGGNISVESEPGQGTTVYFCATFGEADPDGAQPVPAASGNGPEPSRLARRLDILLAEDEPVNALTIRRALELSGHAVTVATDGQACLDLLAARDFDLVLMDVMMPVLDGMEAARAIRDRTRFGSRADVPIVALTAYAMAGDRERVEAAGMDGYLAKPVDFEEMERVMARVMARAAARGMAPAMDSPRPMP
jgi:PAS domain S-box-containing protein